MYFSYFISIFSVANSIPFEYNDPWLFHRYYISENSLSTESESEEQQSGGRENSLSLICDSVSDEESISLLVIELVLSQSFSSFTISQAQRKLWHPPKVSCLAQWAILLAMATSSIDPEME